MAPVIVNHVGLLLAACHVQPAVVSTDTVPPPPDAGAVAVVGEMLKLHGLVNWNVFDALLRAVPPGPTAATVATYTVPGTGQPTSTFARSTRIAPSPSGAGLPSGAV